MRANVAWEGQLAFLGSAESGSSVPLDAGTSAGSFRPLELMLVSLAGCTAMDVVSILQKKGQQVTAFEVKAKAKQAEEHPHVFTEIRLEYLITGHGIKAEAVERAIELSRSRYCPAQAMLGKAVAIELTYRILESAS